MKAILAFEPAPRKEFEYRVYYEGSEITTRMCNPSDGNWPEGDYIVITKEQYNTIHPVYDVVINGKLTRIKNSALEGKRLEKTDKGPYISLLNNIIFVANEGDNYKIKKITNE
jgi:hypothetical protein